MVENVTDVVTLMLMSSERGLIRLKVGMMGTAAENSRLRGGAAATVKKYKTRFVTR